MVPETWLRSGPAVVVKRAERVFSGRSDLRRAVRAAVDDDAAAAGALSLGAAAGSVLGVAAGSGSRGISIAKSAMMWSAVLRRSLDLSGERGLIWGGLELGGSGRRAGQLSHVWFLLEHGHEVCGSGAGRDSHNGNGNGAIKQSGNACAGMRGQGVWRGTR